MSRYSQTSLAVSALVSTFTLVALAAHPLASTAGPPVPSTKTAATGPRPNHAPPKCPPGFAFGQSDDRDFTCTGEVSCPYGWTTVPQRDPNGGGTGLFGASLPVGIRGSTITLVCQLPAPTVVH